MSDRGNDRSNQARQKKKILFLCTNNSARSQMAEGLLKAFGDNNYEVYSAGISPSRVNPYAIKVMAEIGIDLSKYLSKSIDKFQREKFDYVVTLCDQAKKTCPFFPNSKEHLHKSFIDPAGIEEGEDELLNIFRGVRDEIKDWIEKTFISPPLLSE